MISSNSTRRCLTIGMLSALIIFASAQGVDPSLMSGLQWRNIGPFRGGRISAVSGVIGEPGTFYAGWPAGGLWKTTSAGMTWYPVMDDIKSSSSVGAVAVAPSDPNTIYVGMGDFTNGGGVSMGDGVYKSTDAGKTWQHIGLEFAEQIPTILVDPKDPNLVMVAVQGKRYEKTDQRGVYRSTDGGKTWTKALYVDDQTGITRMAWAPDHPEVVLAVTIKHYTDPTAGGGRGGFGGGGGGAPSIYMSTDEGVTWNKIKGDGLPDSGGSARSCVAIANGTDAKRMFFVSNAGLYRSDDQGSTWTQMDKEDDRVRNGQGGYNCGVYVNPKDPDTIYVINTCSYISRDGGKTFTGFKGAPGGDDPQQMWLDPTDGNRMVLGMDQGATISLDGGKNWSSWYNQPNAQLYHISVDNQFPYWVYGTEQDSGSIASASRGNFGEITPLDWLPHPGYEFGSIVADPKDAKISYAGGPGRGIIRTTYPSGQWINVSPNMDRSARLRQVGNQPLAFNPNNSKQLMVGFQYMMDTTDGGLHWKKISPDLTLAPGQTEEQAAAAATQGRPRPAGGGNVADDDDYNGPILNGDGSDGDADEVEELQRGGFGAAIESFSVSTVSPSEIWVGTSNGRIQLTKDNGKTWQDVSIPNPPNGTRADISAIDASHQDAGTAYVAVDCHNAADMKPYFYRTHDYGKSWQEIVNGLPTDQPSGSFSRVIRADTKRSGLLFAGTESSMYVSFNDGDTWQPLMLNLPTTSYRDMVIKDNDLVVGTYGRGMWILDDYSPLREITPAMASESAHLFKPGDAIRVRHNVNGDTPYPPEIPHALNPPDGALIYYYLGSKPAGDVNIDITDSAGHLVRHMSSAPMPAWNEPAPPVPDFWVANPKPIPAAVGLNRTNWDLRYDGPDTFEHSYEINANPNGTPPSPQGPLALPGTYTATMTVDGKSYKQTVVVKNDPRSPADTRDIQAEFAMQKGCFDGSEDAWHGYQQVDAIQKAVKAIQDANPPADVKTAADDIQSKLDAIGGSGRAMRFAAGVGFGAGGNAPTFASLNRIMVGHIETLDSGDMAPSDPMAKACDATLVDLNAVEWAWKQFNARDLADFNAILTKNNLQPIPPAAGVGNPHQPPAPKVDKNAKKTDDKKDPNNPFVTKP